MTGKQNLAQAWDDLPLGARAAIEQQWAGLAAGGLQCGSSVIAADGQLIAAGRNHAYDPAGGIETRKQYPLQHNRLAHAELNALALSWHLSLRRSITRLSPSGQPSTHA